ncbi:MAG TPA: Ig-like domain-containing protein, partial [Nannocystis sp.]
MKSLPAALLLGGCLQPLLDEGDGLVSLTATEADSSSTSSMGEPPTPTTSAGSGVQTVTGGEETTGPSTTSSGDDPGSSSGDAVNQPPTIELFTVDTDYIDAAGPLTLTLGASDDHAVVKVRLYLDGVKLADLTPADFPYTFDVLSAKFNGDQRIFKVVVEDAEGLAAEREADPVKVWLPASGVERCIFTDPGEGSVISYVSAIKFTPEAIIAVGTRDTGAGPMLTVWKLDPDTCDLRPGWPKSMTNWSTHDDYKKAVSIGAAVDIDEDGNIVVAGNFWVGNKPQGYVVLLTESGSRLWEKAGQPGDEITSVAAATGQFKDRVFVGGSLRTSENPVRTDGAVWVYQANGETAFVSPPNILAAPFAPGEQLDDGNKRSEWVRALVIHPSTGNA